eukprot:TRINITY_DN417_c0_g1_i1.p1 TRINITY_DN417_c0_g1~~TRINITY_DN417_c0_g1_i1.p1  ORF type:complete len:239 (+),score=34.88 TRINITY_DN417_c0_g1_i1:70-786(+)
MSYYVQPQPQVVIVQQQPAMYVAPPQPMMVVSQPVIIAQQPRAPSLATLGVQPYIKIVPAEGEDIKYALHTKDDKEVLRVVYNGNCCGKLLFGVRRSYDLEFSASGYPDTIFRMSRPFDLPLTRWKVEVFDGHNKLLGSVRQKFTLITSEFVVFDESSVEIFRIHAPFFLFGNCEFLIKKEGSTVGNITRRNGLCGTNPLNITIDFPDSATSGQKALLTSAAFMLNSAYFERRWRLLC